MPLSENVRRLVGVELLVASGEVVAADFQQWAASVGDLNPVYFDDAAAKAAGYRGMVMPPLYAMHVCQGPIDLSSLHQDGSRSDDPMVALPVPGRRLMAGGEDIEVLAPVYPGDVLTARCTLTSVVERTGSEGAFLLVDFGWTFVNQQAELVTTSRSSIVVR